MSSSSTTPRPIHRPPREIRSKPDETEPSLSCELESFLPKSGEEIEDEYYRRLAKGSSNSGGGGGGSRVSSSSTSSSFWRDSTLSAASASSSATTAAASVGPSFSSMNMRSSTSPDTHRLRNSNNSASGGRPQSDGATPRGTNNNTRNTGSALSSIMASAEKAAAEASSSSARRGSNNTTTTPTPEPNKQRKDQAKQRTAARRLKYQAQHSEIDSGHLQDDKDNNDGQKQTNMSSSILVPPTEGSLSRGSSTTSDACSPSLLYGKTLHTTPRNSCGAAATVSSLLSKGSSSLIFPTGVEAPDGKNGSGESAKERRINLILDQVESVRLRKKKLVLERMDLLATEVPMKYLDNTSLGNSLHKLSLKGNNRLAYVPPKLVVCLPALKTLDLSQCELHQLPDKWDLPQLKRLDLSHNRLSEFPDEIMLEGLPELTELNMYGNKVAEIIIPHNTKLLSKLETLNLGYNDLAYLPDELDQLKALRTLKLMRNFLERIPFRVCDMDIRDIDVSSNPLIQPPIETCERGMCSMKRYYHCLRNEEQEKHKALEKRQKEIIRKQKREEKNKFRKMKHFFKSPSARAKSVTEEMPSAQSMILETEASVSEKAESSSEYHVSDELRETKEDALKTVEEAIKPAVPEAVLVDETIIESAKVRKSSEETSSTVTEVDTASMMLEDESMPRIPTDDITVNDTLKVIFVGMAMAGKTSMIKRLIEGKDAKIPKRDERTVGVDIYEWDPRDSVDVDTRIQIEDKTLAKTCGDVNVKFSVWDFAGQHVYHATHELFFSPRSLYVLVWDMGATNRNTLHKRSSMDADQGSYSLSYESSDDEDDDDDFLMEEEARRADRALERDIDEKVQFWVDCIQSSAPGATILPVASFDDYFSKGGNQDEAERRCNAMKNRLLKHEERRIAGIKERLKEYTDEGRANDEGALRLQQLLCPYTRPKLIFGDDDKNSVVRVSGTKFTGFGQLTERLVHIATGRERPSGWKYPIFRGHVGAQIPRMRLEVREAVREMRDRFKVVEWGYFLSTLRKRGLTSVEDISDALHFLTNIGELSYFGNVFPDKPMIDGPMEGDMKRRLEALTSCAQQPTKTDMTLSVDDNESDHMDDDDDEDERRLLLMDDTTTDLASTVEDSSLRKADDFSSAGLSQYVFLNPRWLVAAVACILRHDLDREIRETRRSMQRLEAHGPIERGESFYEANLNCPVITACDAEMLWAAKKFTKKAAERAQKAAERAQLYSNNLSMTPFVFLQRLLVRFGVFVPIDLTIDKAFLGGKEYARDSEYSRDQQQDTTTDAPHSNKKMSEAASFFFLPSLLGPGEPSEAWTYKNTDSWKTTICHSLLFPDGVPPGLMERITASVLSSVYAVAHQVECLRVKEILCWRTAFFLKLGTEVSRDNDEVKESVVEIFAHLVDRESHLCVGSDSMGTGMRRLILSAKGQVGDGGRKIWTGGYLLVARSIGRVMAEYGGLEYEKQGFCPECLSKKAVSQACSWDWTVIRTAGQNGDESMRCHHGHRVDTRLIAGPCDSLAKPKQRRESIRQQPKFTDSEPIIPVNDLLRGVVLVGLWDGRTRKVVRVGSGFIVDKKRGLIVTASHTLMNIWGDRNTPFGENYYGLREGKIVVGVIPRKNESDKDVDETRAVFRYFAKIAAKDPNIEEKGECQADACVLRITTRMENDIVGNGEGIGNQPETLLLNNPDALKREKLQQLKVTEKCELDEQVRILGYNQGGEGLLGPGESLNCYVDFGRGYVCKKFATGEEASGEYLRHRFKPLQEVVVICPTIGGHSGGPCVNQQGEVIGILSRADPTESQRCYLVPATEWKPLVKKAKNNPF